MSRPIETYRHFKLYLDRKPIPTPNCDYEAIHNDYDGPGDNRCFYGPTLTDLVRQVDDYWLEECTDCEGDGKYWNNADPTSGQWVTCETCGEPS